MYHVCKNRRWLLDRAKLERYTSRCNVFSDVDVLHVKDEQEWVIVLLLTIVSSRSPEHDYRDCQRDYRNAVVGLENITCLRSHAHLYALAHRLRMEKLRDYTFEMFKMDAQIDSTDSKVMLGGVVAVYNEIDTSANAALLKKIIVDAWMLGGVYLAQGVDRDVFQRLMAVVPDFVADLHARMMVGSTSVDSSNRPQYLCNECGAREFVDIPAGVVADHVYCPQCGGNDIIPNLLAALRLEEMSNRS
jgi:hypothetical protein